MAATGGQTPTPETQIMPPPQNGGTRKREVVPAVPVDLHLIENERKAVEDRIQEIQQERDPLQKQLKTTELFKDILTSFKNSEIDAQTVRNVLIRVRQPMIPQADIQRAEIVQIAVKKIFEVIRKRLFTRENIEKVINAINQAPGNEDIVTLLQNLLPKVDDDDTMEILVNLANKGGDETTGAFFHEFIMKLVHPDDDQRMNIELSQPGSTQQTAFERYFDQLKKDNPRSARILGEAVLKRARDRGGAFKGIGLPALEQRFTVTEPTPEELAQQLEAEQRRGGDIYSDRNKVDKILNLIEDDLSAVQADKSSEIFRTAERAKRLITHLDTVNTFSQFYEDEYQRTLGAIQNPTDYQKRDAAQRTARNIQSSILYIVNTIYRNVLNDNNEPSEEFRQAASASDPYYNPNVLYKFFNDRLVSLKMSANREIGKQTADFYTFKRQITKVYDVDTKQEVEEFGITAELEKTDIFQFLSELEAITETELGLLEYGYNFRLLTLHGVRQEGARLFNNISTYAFGKATTDAFDRIKVLQDSELITAAQTSLMTHLFSMLADKGHIKSREFAEELFTREGTLLAEVAADLTEHYSHIDTWRRTRAIRHAMTRIFGAEFMFQMAMSFADPPEDFTGEMDISGKNSTFLWQELAMRWGASTSHDFNFKGAIFYPSKYRLKNFKDWDEMRRRGKAVWGKMKKHGFIACFEDESFYRAEEGEVEAVIPLIATPGNVTKAGGPNTMIGWRVRPGLVPLIQQYMKREQRHGVTLNTKVNGVFTKLWKSVENSGVNNVRTLAEADILNDKFFDAKGGWLQKDKFEDLTKFLYRRYFKQGIGQSFLPGTFQHDETGDTFWNYLNREIKERRQKDHTKKEVEIAREVMEQTIYQAMTVMIYERTPLEFLYKSRIRDEQNGITAIDELRKELNWGNDEKGIERWTKAKSDLEFVQMEARREVTNEINDRRKQEDWRTFDENGNEVNKNIYGDISKDWSSVRGDKGYVIDEAYIEELLVKKYLGRDKGRNVDDPTEWNNIMQEFHNLPDDDSNKVRVRNAIEMHRKLTKILKDKPRESALEADWKKAIANPNTKLEDKERLTKAIQLAENWKKERLKWFTESWQENRFNSIPFLLDKTWDWETESLTDKNNVQRCAYSVSQTAEEVTHRRTDRGSDTMFITLAKDTVRKGPDIWRTFKSYISSFKKTIGDEVPDGSVVPEIGYEEIRRFLMMLTRDESARGLIGEVKNRLTRQNRGSLAAGSWTNYVGQDFGPSEVRAFIRVLVNDSAISLREAEELAAEFDATWYHVVKDVSPKIGVVLFALLLLQYLKEAYEKEIEEA